MVNRNWDHPDYPRHKKWREAVKKRDRHRCQMPGCGSAENLEAHHIVPYGEDKSLAWKVSNGITPCKAHHEEVDKNEAAYVELFRGIVREKTGRDPALLMLLKRPKPDQ